MKAPRGRRPSTLSLTIGHFYCPRPARVKHCFVFLMISVNLMSSRAPRARAGSPDTTSGVSGPCALLPLEALVLGIFAPHIVDAVKCAVRVHKIKPNGWA